MAMVKNPRRLVQKRAPLVCALDVAILDRRERGDGDARTAEPGGAPRSGDRERDEREGCADADRDRRVVRAGRFARLVERLFFGA